MFHQFLKACLYVALAAALSHAGDAQNQSTRIYGSLDSDVPLPIRAGTQAHVDAAALEEIQQHRRVVGSTPWVAMQGAGQITFGGNDNSPYTATLYIIGDRAFRLDAQTSKGPLSIRISGKYGVTQSSDGHQVNIPPDTAASGIIQFEMPRLASFPDQTASLIDHGPALIGGKPLHRVAFEFPLNPIATPQNDERVATDLYFDPTSHLLVKSANSIRVAGSGKNEFLRVITYEDYRQVGDSMIPFRYTQTLNGQEQWILQFSDVQLNPDLPASLFEF